MPSIAPRFASFTAVEILNEDHKRISELIALFERVKGDADAVRKKKLVDLTCLEIVLHNDVKAELFYPAVRACMEARALDEAEVEQGAARHLIALLQTQDPEDPRFEATFNVLGHYLRYHMEAEANDIFPRARQGGCDTQELGAEIAKRKAELRERPAGSSSRARLVERNRRSARI